MLCQKAGKGTGRGAAGAELGESPMHERIRAVWVAGLVCTTLGGCAGSGPLRGGAVEGSDAAAAPPACIVSIEEPDGTVIQEKWQGYGAGLKRQRLSEEPPQKGPRLEAQPGTADPATLPAFPIAPAAD